MLSPFFVGSADISLWAAISHDRTLSCTLHDSDGQRLKLIREALSRTARGDYGQCACCRDDIGGKRLVAIPWATHCVKCQEELEREMLPLRIRMLAPVNPVDDENEISYT